MAKQNTFLCECGRIIARMNKKMGYLRWNQEKDEPVHRGIICGGCKQGYIWKKPRSGDYVDVKKCCKQIRCDCV